MTTGATGQLGLALPVQGELSGTWGDTVNNGITQYTNIAIAGTLTLTGDGAVTLANTTGDASASNITSTLAGAGTVTAQFAVVRVSGTTTTKVVTGPSYSKTYLVDNASSFAVTFKASGQTGVSVAAAEKVSVYFNGTDYVKIAGTIANAAGSNTQIQFNNGGLFGASANLTWDGTPLSSTQVNITGQGTLRLQDTTGGEYVGLRSPSALGASYTLTFPADDGTSGQALITDGSGVLSWSTAASGDVYGPGSSTDNAVARIDSTTGKIIQNSVVIVGDTGDVTGVGTLSAATLNLTNALGTAYGGTNLTSFTSGGVVYASSSSALATGSALVFDGSKLGIGTTTPQNLFVVSNSGAAGFEVNPADASGVALAFYNRSGAAWANSIYYANNQIFCAGGTSEQMRLTTTGLGIGTSSPAYKLDVTSTSSAVGSFARTTGTAVVKIQGISGNSVLAFGDGSTIGATSVWSLGRKNSDNSFRINYNEDSLDTTNYVTLKTDGNFGIGTSSPVEKLTVQSTGNTIGSFRSSGASYVGVEAVNSSQAFSMLVRPDVSNALVFRNETTSTNQLVLNTSGNLGLGVTPSAWSGAAKALQIGSGLNGGSIAGDTGYGILRLYANAYYNAGDKYVKSGEAASSYEMWGYDGTHIWKNAPTNAGAAGAACTFTSRMTLDASGNLGVGTTSPASYGKFSVIGTGSTASVLDNGAARITNTVVSGGGSYTQYYKDLTPTYVAGIGAYSPATSTAVSGIVFSDYQGGWTERARISSDGTFRVKGAGTAGSTDAVQFSGSAPASSMALDSSGRLLVGITSNPIPGKVFSQDTQNPFVSWNPSTSGNNGFIDFGTEATFTERGYIYYNRAAGQTQLSATSDERLKENIVDYGTALPLINSLRVRQFDWKETGNTCVGFIAQELYEIVPEAVSVGENNEDGTIKRHWGISKDYLVPYLVKAMQEQQAIIESLKARLDAANL